MEGTLESKEGQVIVAGTFKGNVIAKSLIIEQTSLFTGKINAEHVRIEGKADADITADHLEVSNTGTIDGKLKTNSLSVDSGAQISVMYQELVNSYYSLSIYAIFKKLDCFRYRQFYLNSLTQIFKPKDT